MQDGYHLTEELADRAIEFLGDLRAVDANKPFFLYFATGACHSPHQPPPKWREHYRGRFDLGWDAWRGRGFEGPLSPGLPSAATQLSARAAPGAASGPLADAGQPGSPRVMGGLSP